MNIRGFHVLAFAFSIAVLPSLVFSDEWSGQCSGATQGDTILVTSETGQVVEVRIWGIDSPDPGQEFNLSATALAAQMLSGKTVTIEEVLTDGDGRVIGKVKLEGKDVAAALTISGAAMYDSRYVENKRLEEAENKARSARRGLWAYSNPTPPWEFAAAKKAEERDLLAGMRGGVHPMNQGPDGDEDEEGSSDGESDSGDESRVKVTNTGQSAAPTTPSSFGSGRLAISSHYLDGSSLVVFVDVPRRCSGAGHFGFEVTYLLWGKRQTTTGRGSWGSKSSTGTGRANLSDEAKIINVRLTDSSCR